MKKLLLAIALGSMLASPAMAEQTAYNAYATTNVTTAAYVQVISSVSYATNQVQIQDTSGQIMILALGAPGSEVDTWLIPSTFAGTVNVNIPAGSRVSLKAKTASATTGTFLINVVKKI